MYGTVLGWRFHCTGLEVPLYWAEGSVVLGWRFHCSGLEVPLYRAVPGRSSIVLGTGGSIVWDCTGQEVPLYWA